MARKKKRKKKQKTEEMGPPEPGADQAPQVLPQTKPESEVVREELQEVVPPASTREPYEESQAEPEEAAATPAPPWAGLSAKLVRWWRRLPEPSEGDSVPPGSPEVPEGSLEPAVGVAESQPLPAAVEVTPLQPAAEGDELSHLRAEVSHLRQALDDALGQRREEMEAAKARRNQLEAELEQSRAEAETAQAKLREEESRAQALEAELGGQKQLGDELQAKLGEEESRAQALEAELGGQKQLGDELQAKLDHFAQQLAIKEQELSAVRSRSDEELAQAQQAAKQALSQVRDQQAALDDASKRIIELQTELSAQKAQVERLQAEKTTRPATPAPPPSMMAGTTGASLSPAKAAELYQQVLSPLTVLMASADLLVMNPQMDASLRETAMEVKTQSATLLELIKRYTRPTEPS